MNRAPSKESEEEESLLLGEESRLRGGTSGDLMLGGVVSSRVGVEPKSTALPQEEQKRAASGTTLPQAGQIMGVAGVYHCPLLSLDSVERSLPKNALLGDSRRQIDLAMGAA